LLKAAWTLAIETLSWMELKGLSERSALNRASKQLRIKNLNIVGLTHKMVHETIRRKNLIDFMLNSVLKPRALNNFRLGLQAFLRLYVYEAKFEEGGSYAKAVNIARIGRAILGGSELQDVEETLGELLTVSHERLLLAFDDEQKTALSTFTPRWYVRYCFRLLGRDRALSYLESSRERLPIYIRINTLKAAEKPLLARIADEEIALESVPKLRHAYKVLGSQVPLTRTRSFRTGDFFIQDKASCLAVEIASPRPGQTVLDACGAPGAKTTYLAQLMENEGTVYSIDYSRRRMAIWQRETKRMGVRIAMPIIADIRNPLPPNLSIDLAILDPPCTSTGVFNKMPSAKWRLTKRSMQGMARIQWNMLRQCAKAVRSGGHLVYSTCSIALEENEMLIERFLKRHPEYTLVDTEPRIGLPGFRGQTKCQRLHPHIHQCNGFFVAKLRKEP
jgi:16S rRNA (cytosine967-C5)-methyltransferase